MIALTMHEGRAAVAVTDSKKKTALYWFQRLEGGVLELTNAGDPLRRSLIRPLSSGGLICDCKGWQFKKDRSTGCKHMQIAEELLPLLEVVGAA